MRNPEKARQAFGPAVTYRPDDLQNEGNVRALLQNQEGVYLNLTVSPKSGKANFQPEHEGLRPVLAGIRQPHANARRIHPSAELILNPAGSALFNN